MFDQLTGGGDSGENDTGVVLRDVSVKQHVKKKIADWQQLEKFHSGVNGNDLSSGQNLKKLID